MQYQSENYQRFVLAVGKIWSVGRTDGTFSVLKIISTLSDQSKG